MTYHPLSIPTRLVLMAALVITTALILPAAVAMIQPETTFTVPASSRFSSIFSFHFDQNAFLDLTISLRESNTKPISLMFCSASQVQRIESSNFSYSKVCATLPMGICDHEVEIKPANPDPTPSPTPTLLPDGFETAAVQPAAAPAEAAAAVLLDDNTMEQVYVDPQSQKKYVITHRYTPSQDQMSAADDDDDDGADAEADFSQAWFQVNNKFKQHRQTLRRFVAGTSKMITAALSHVSSSASQDHDGATQSFQILSTDGISFNPDVANNYGDADGEPVFPTLTEANLDDHDAMPRLFSPFSVTTTTTDLTPTQLTAQQQPPDFRLSYDNSIPTRSMYYVLQLNCHSIDYKVSMAYTAINPNGEHLSLHEVPNRSIFTGFIWIYLAFLAGLTAYAAYGYFFCHGFPLKYPVFIPIASITVLTMMYCYMADWYWNAASATGTKRFAYILVAHLFSAAGFYIYILFFIAMGLGYGVIRASIPWPTLKRMMLIALFMAISKFTYEFGVGLGVLLHMLNLLFVWMIYLDGLRLSLTMLQLEIEVLQSHGVKLRNTVWRKKTILTSLLHRRTADYIAEDGRPTSVNTNGAEDGIGGKDLPIVQKLEILIKVQHICHIFLLLSILAMIYNNSMGVIAGYITSVVTLLLFVVTLLRLAWALRTRYDDNEALYILSLLYTRGTLSADINEKVIAAVQGDLNTTAAQLVTSDSMVSSQSHAELLRYHSNIRNGLIANGPRDYNSSPRGSSSSSSSNGNPDTGHDGDGNDGSETPERSAEWYLPSLPTKIVPPHTLKFNSFQYNLLIAMLRGTSLNKNNISLMFAPCQCFQHHGPSSQDGGQIINHVKTNPGPFLNFDGRYGVCPHSFLGLRWLTGITNPNKSGPSFHHHHHNTLNNSSTTAANFLSGQALLPGTSSPHQPHPTPAPVPVPSINTTELDDGYIDINSHSNTSTGSSDLLLSGLDLSSLEFQQQQHEQQQQHQQQQQQQQLYPEVPQPSAPTTTISPTTAPSTTATPKTSSQFTSLNAFDTITGFITMTSTTDRPKAQRPVFVPPNPARHPAVTAAVENLSTAKILVRSGLYSTNDVPLVQPQAPLFSSQPSQQRQRPAQLPRTLQHPPQKTKNGLYHPFENQEPVEDN